MRFLLAFLIIFVAAQDFCPKRTRSVNNIQTPDFCTMFQILITSIDSDSIVSPLRTCNDRESLFLNEKLEFYISEFARSFFRANDLRLNSPLSELDPAIVTKGSQNELNTLGTQSNAVGNFSSLSLSRVNFTAESSLFSTNISVAAQPTMKPFEFVEDKPVTTNPAQFNLPIADDDFTVLRLENQVTSVPSITLPLTMEPSLTVSPESNRPPNMAPMTPSNVALLQSTTKLPTSRPTNRPTNRPTIRPTIRPTDKVSKTSSKFVTKETDKKTAPKLTTPTTKSKRGLKSDRLTLRAIFIWGGSSSWTCRSCFADKWDNRRRDLQATVKKELPLDMLEVFMSEKLTLAMNAELVSIMEEINTNGCLGRSDLYQVHFQVVMNES
jgi:hypothetical protein